MLSSGSPTPPAATTPVQYLGPRWMWRCWRRAPTGVTLSGGQVALVRQMATSGARLQLVIAPAGAGKTTAMQALAVAWTKAGGTVIGLAPSAAAAAQLATRWTPRPTPWPSSPGPSSSTTCRLGPEDWAVDPGGD
jgi:hypothetical protein